MRLERLACASFAIAGLGAQGLELKSQRNNETPKTVSHKIYRHQVAHPVARDRSRGRLRRQSGTLNIPLENDLFLYYMKMTVGTPEQDFYVHLDTGSSDLWLNTIDSQYCSSSGSICQSGTYAANDSSTYKFINSNFEIQYADGSGATGDYVSDTVRLGGVSLENQRFGVGYVSQNPDGILGVGYPTNEASTTSEQQPYANVPVSLLNTGHISTLAYSLWLNDLDAAEGTILFGGIDTDKYSGELETIAIVPDQGYYVQFTIPLIGLGMNDQDDSITGQISNLNVHLDSGATLTYLPDQITATIYEMVGAQYDTSQQAAFVDCDLANQQSTLNFKFTQGKTIKVPMDEMVINADGQNCVFGILPSGDSTYGQAYYIMGDTVLRSAYVVYDLTNNEISIAQTVFNATGSNIVELTNGTQGSPSGSGSGSTSAAGGGGGGEGGGSGGSTFTLPVGSLSSAMATATTEGSPTVTVTVGGGSSATESSQASAQHAGGLGSIASFAMVVVAGMFRL